MRVEEYLVYRAKIKGVDRRERASRLDYALDRCRLREVRRRRLGTLSKGYRQRVGLADAMIHDPPIFILDEPTAGLDPIQIRETLALIRELGDNHTILLSTHILSEVEAVCERVIIINAGRIGFSQQLAQIEAHAVILLEVRGPADQVSSTLKGTQGVSQVVSKGAGEGFCGFEINTRDDADLRETIGQTLMQKGWHVRRLERQRRKLEDAFFAVLREEDPLKEHGGERTAPSEAIKR
jgi:ABC-2 type transport system ATP-binding protein